MSNGCLPSFLHPVSARTSRGPYLNAAFSHKPPLAPVHALWWPPQHPEISPDVVVLFIPGNPGLLDFYTSFLTVLHEKGTPRNLAILAHAHIAHTPGVAGPPSEQNLTYQVESAIQAFDTLAAEFSQSKILLVGHSVGSWVSLQVLKARPNMVSGVFLLFPTICRIADTPNGRKLSPLFKPIPRIIISHLSHLTRLIPFFLLRKLFWDWPDAQLQVLRDFLDSPTCILASLSMADQEMQIIRDLDIALLQHHRQRLWFYFAEHDHWVGEQKDHLLSQFEPNAETLCVANVPHAFCINHSEGVALQCHRWLSNIR